jgi:hypothetical protein
VRKETKRRHLSFVGSTRSYRESRR